MVALRRGRAAGSGTSDPALWLAVGMALLTALSYVLIGLEVLGVGDLAASERPAGIIVAAAAGYVLGGLLILLRRRWLWVVGAVVNAMVISMFLMGYLDRPAVLFSPGGLVTKVVQVVLECALLYLIVTGAHRARAVS